MRTLIIKKKLTIFLKNETFAQANKYLVVAVVCTILDFILLFVLNRYCGLNYLISSVISFMSGTVLNYVLCTFWVFKIRVIKKRQLEFIYYLIITSVGLAINTGIIWSLTEFLGLYFMLSKFISLFFTFCWNFGARKYFLHSVS
jgi:putative flippase GtrA